MISLNIAQNGPETRISCMLGITKTNRHQNAPVDITFGHWQHHCLLQMETEVSTSGQPPWPSWPFWPRLAALLAPPPVAERWSCDGSTPTSQTPLQLHTWIRSRSRTSDPRRLSGPRRLSKTTHRRTLRRRDVLYTLEVSRSPVHRAYLGTASTESFA